MFEIAGRDDGAVRVVTMTGEFDVAACPGFRAECERDGTELLVVDLRDVTFLDSHALGELMALQQAVEATGSRLAILRPRGWADRIFKLTGMDGHLPLFDDRLPILAEFNYG
jgi:anti-sigma B factor antagonist